MPVSDEEIGQGRNSKIHQDLAQRIDLVLVPDRTDLQEGETAVHGENHDRAEQKNEQYVAACLELFHLLPRGYCFEKLGEDYWISRQSALSFICFSSIRGHPNAHPLRRPSIRMEVHRLHPVRVQLRHRGAARRRRRPPFARCAATTRIPASRGYACEKPLRLDFYQNGPHRLTKPLRRRADGTFEEIDWDTAIREVAGALRGRPRPLRRRVDLLLRRRRAGEPPAGPLRTGDARAARLRPHRERDLPGEDRRVLGRRRRWSAASRAATSSTARWGSSWVRTRGSRTAFRTPASPCARSRRIRPAA